MTSYKGTKAFRKDLIYYLSARGEHLLFPNRSCFE